LSKLPYYVYKLYNFLYKCRIPLVPKLLSVINRIIFGAHIPPSCILGSNIRFSYGGAAVVIHGRAAIGNDCTIAPCVTIGGRGVKNKNVPVIGDNVYIGGGAKILGDIHVGDNAIIAPNCVVLKDVPSNCIIAGIPGVIIKSNITKSDYV
jgi:serine O-acetyltransferase